MATLKQQAEDLGIEVDNRWSEATLKEKIAEAKAAKAKDPETPTPEPTPPPTPPADDGKAAKAKDDTVEVTLKRDYWPEDGERVAKGGTVRVPRTKARELLANEVIEAPSF